MAFVAAAARFTDWVDRRLVNGLVNGIGRLSLQSAENLRLSVSGQLQSYVFTVVVAIVLLLSGISWWGGLPELLPQGLGNGLAAGLRDAPVEVLR